MANMAGTIRRQNKIAKLEARGIKLGPSDGPCPRWPRYEYEDVVEAFRADDKLVSLPVTELARRFDTTPSTIYRALSKVGIKPESRPGRRRRRWPNRETVTEAVVTHLDEYGTEDKSDRALAAELDVSHNTIGRARRKRGLPARPPGRPRGPAEKDAEVVKLRDRDGLTFAEIGERLAITRQAAHKRYRLAVERVLCAAGDG